MARPEKSQHGGNYDVDVVVNNLNATLEVAKGLVCVCVCVCDKVVCESECVTKLCVTLLCVKESV